MQPASLPLIFRAYGKNTKPSTRAERMSNMVVKWLQDGTCLLTNGPAEPISRPINTVNPLPVAIDQVRTLMEVHEPAYLWRYPLVLHIQLWTAGWDVHIAPETLIEERFCLDNRRTQTLHLLQRMIKSMHPTLLIGPTKKPPISVNHAMQEHARARWTTFFIGDNLQRRFDWKEALARRQADIQRLNGGLWAKIPDSGFVKRERKTHAETK